MAGSARVRGDLGAEDGGRTVNFAEVGKGNLLSEHQLAGDSSTRLDVCSARPGGEREEAGPVHVWDRDGGTDAAKARLSDTASYNEIHIPPLSYRV